MARTLMGTRIRERRRAKKLTQTALAKSVGISASYLNLIEHNRRGIAGRTMLAIARELGMQPADLTEGADAALINTLTESAKADPKAAPEVDRIEEFVGRYPGWAKLLGSMARTTHEQRETLTAMTDQMAHDPFVSETMHQILSNITAIRSTASILATETDIPKDMHERFLGNLHRDSQRLSDTAQKMVDFFDKEDKSEPNAPTTAVAHDFWATRDYVLSNEPETTFSSNPQTAPILENSVQRFAQLDQMMPVDAFIEAAKKLHYDPIALSQAFDVDLMQVLFRMAQMPSDAPFPTFGLIEVDMSGAVLMRKPTPELALPLYSSACPLWPIYRAFSQPAQILRTVMEMPSGDRVLAYALAQPKGATDYALPPILRSTMIFSADPKVLGKDHRTPILAGLHCSVCPRKSCDARRVDYILA
ncbi:MAG: short-chain fatty acyl-CoA regulator family protein [Amylibacter sp.]